MLPLHYVMDPNLEEKNQSGHTTGHQLFFSKYWQCSFISSSLSFTQGLLQQAASKILWVGPLYMKELA